MKKNNLPGIALFVYNRPNHLIKTLKSLKKNHQASKFEIFIFCDGPKKNLHIKKIKQVQKIAKNVKFFSKNKIYVRKKNIGLAKSILNGVSTVLKKKNSVIVLEDDIVTNNHYLKYMTDALNFFENDKLIGSVTGYSYTDVPKNYSKDIFLSQRHASWGWGTWKNVWEKMQWEKKWAKRQLKSKDFKKNFNKSGNDMHQILKEQLEGKSDTLDIMFNLNCFKMNLFCVCPKKSLLYNIGLDGSGIHCKKGDKVFSNYSNYFRVKKFEKLKVETNIIKKIHKSFTTPIPLRIYNKIKNYLI